MNKTDIILGDMLIGDILNQYPDSAKIMEGFGLHCTSCSVNAYEPIRAGALSHGIGEKAVDKLMKELNEHAWSKRKAPIDGIYMTESAAKKVEEFAKAEDKAGYALRITAKDNKGLEPAYGMDFIEKPEEGDHTETFHGVTLIMDSESFENMKGAEIDFLDTQFGSGFKISNPRFIRTESGGCDNSGCGCGTGQGKGGCGSGGCGC